MTSPSRPPAQNEEDEKIVLSIQKSQVFFYDSRQLPPTNNNNNKNKREREKKERKERKKKGKKPTPKNKKTEGEGEIKKKETKKLSVTQNLQGKRASKIVFKTKTVKKKQKTFRKS